MGLRPPKVMKTLKNQSTGRLRSRLGKRSLPNRDRKGVGAVGRFRMRVFKGARVI
jgi:hypothetical protein